MECKESLHLFEEEEPQSRCLCGLESWESIGHAMILERMWEISQ